MNHAIVLSTLILGFIPYCEIGGGESESSVATPGEDGVTRKAEATGGKTTAFIELERKTRNVKGRGEVRYVFDKSLTEQHLNLVVGKGGEHATFVLAEHDKASSFDTHELEIDASGERVAYKLGANPWHIIYVLRSELAVHSPAEFSELNWATIPEIEDVFIDVYAAQKLQLNGLYSFLKKPLMVAWLNENQGEEATVKMLIDMLGLGLDTDYTKLVENLTPSGKSWLRDEMRRRLVLTSQPPRLFYEAFKLGYIDLSKTTELTAIRNGLTAMTRKKNSFISYETAVDAYLRALATHELDEAGRFACALFEKTDRPFTLEKGRPTHRSALAVLARSGKECAAAVDPQLDLCLGNALCAGEPCSRDELNALVNQTLSTGLAHDRDAWLVDETVIPRLTLAMKGIQPRCQ